jgi:hypothetical protein
MAAPQAASKLLLLLNENRPVKGNPAINSRIGQVTPRTILARTNASTMTAIIEALDAGKSPHLVGGTDELMEMLRGVQHFQDGPPRRGACHQHWTAHSQADRLPR